MTIKRNDTIGLKGSATVKNTAVINSQNNKNVGHGNAIDAGTITDVNEGQRVVIENCYFKGNHGNQGWWIDPHSVHGEVVFRNCTFERLCDAIYGELGPPHGVGGRVIVENCLFKDINIAAIRLGKGGVARNCVIFNTGNVPENEKGQINSRGLHTFYPSRGEVTVENVHVDVTNQNTNKGPGAAVAIKPHGPMWNIKNSQLKGARADNGRATYTNVGSNPSHTPPDGVPTSPQQAHNGGGVSGGIPAGAGGSVGSPPMGGTGVMVDTQMPTNKVVVRATGGRGEYSLKTGGSFKKGDAFDSGGSDSVSGNTASGVVAGQGTDSYIMIGGDLEHVETTGNAKVLVDGVEVNPAEINTSVQGTVKEDGNAPPQQTDATKPPSPTVLSPVVVGGSVIGAGALAYWYTQNN